MENNLIFKVGDVFKSTFSFTQDQVNLFAEISGDKNPLHIDAQFAKSTLFGRPIIHGFLGGAMFSKILGTEFPGFGTIYLKQNLIFLKPMFVNETYMAVLEIIEIIKEKHRAIISTKILNANSEEVITGEALIMNSKKL